MNKVIKFLFLLTLISCGKEVPSTKSAQDSIAGNWTAETVNTTYGFAPTYNFKEDGTYEKNSGTKWFYSETYTHKDKEFYIVVHSFIDDTAPIIITYTLTDNNTLTSEQGNLKRN